MHPEAEVKGVEIVRLPEVMKIDAAPGWHEELCGLIDAGRRRLLLDLSNVRLMDASGLSVILIACKRARDLGGDVAILRPLPKIRALLDFARADQILGIYDDLLPALTAMEAARLGYAVAHDTPCSYPLAAGE